MVDFEFVRGTLSSEDSTIRKDAPHNITPLRAPALDGHLARGAKFSDRVAGGKEFHGRVAVVLEPAERPEDVLVIDLAGAGLVPAGDVGDVNESHFIDVLFQFLDQVPFRDLLVEEIVKELHL